MAKLTLVEARECLGWTQSQLAKEAGMAVSTIHDLETGHNRNPGYQIVMRVVKTLQRGGLVGIKAEDVFPIDSEAVA